MENYLEQLDLPDGQWAKLLTRLPHDRANAIEVAKEREEAITQLIAAQAGVKHLPRGTTYSGWLDAVAKAHLWEASFKDYLTEEEIGAEDLARANPFVIHTVQMRAAVLYSEWFREANPGPKGSSKGRASRTPTSKKASSTSETSEPA